MRLVKLKKEKRLRYKYHIELVTATDCFQFVNAITDFEGDIYLTDGKTFKLSAKSILGALASTEWTETYAESDTECYSVIQQWVK